MKESILELLNKGMSFWFVVIGAAMYVYTAHKDLPFIPRVTKVISSVLIGLGTFEEAAERFGGSEKIMLGSIIVICWVAIDVAVTLLLDYKNVVAVIKSRMGK